MQATSYGTAAANQLAIPKGSPWYTPYERYCYDIEKAKSLLDTAGAKGRTLDMLVTSEYPETVTAAQIIADNLEPLGIDVKIRTVDFATWLDEQNNGNFDMLMMGWLGNIDPDDFYYSQHHTGGKSNAQKFSNADVDKLLDAGRTKPTKTHAGTLRQGGHDHRRPGQLHLPLQPVGDPSLEYTAVGIPSARRRRHPLPHGEAQLIAFVRRLIYSLVVLLGVLVVVFALVHLVPGDPVRIALGTRYTPEAYAALRSVSGLDRPLLEQFFSYAAAVTGDLGVSFRNGDPVTLTLLDRLPATVSLAVAGNRHRAAHLRAGRHRGGVAGGPGVGRHCAHCQPIRRLDTRLLDGNPAHRSIRRDAGMAADVRLSTVDHQSGRLVRTSSCPAPRLASWREPS